MNKPSQKEKVLAHLMTASFILRKLLKVNSALV